MQPNNSAWVEIEFEGPYSIKVLDGILNAVGTEEDSITFTGINWKGEVETPGSLIKYKIIEEGGDLETGIT